jgi:hypothetical protein
MSTSLSSHLFLNVIQPLFDHIIGKQPETSLRDPQITNFAKSVCDAIAEKHAERINSLSYVAEQIELKMIEREVGIYSR